jgi:hypothetical protein
VEPIQVVTNTLDDADEPGWRNSGIGKQAIFSFGASYAGRHSAALLPEADK